MKICKGFLLFIVALIFVSTSGLALAKEYEGKAVIPYKPSAFSSKPSDETKHKAIDKAKLNAWKNYTSGFNMARQKE